MGHPLLRALLANDARDALPFLTTQAGPLLDAATRLAVPVLRQWMPEDMTTRQVAAAVEFIGRLLASHALLPTAAARDVSAICAGAVEGALAAARVLAQ